MSRFALAVAFALIAATSFAQTDPRSNLGGQPASPVVPRTGGPDLTARPVQSVLVGERAPDFELQTAGGTAFRLLESRGGWVALFFADRREELPRVAALAQTLDSLRVRTIAVTPEKLRALAAWSDAGKVRILALADERGDISALYGLWDNTRSATRQGMFLLDPNGVVRLALLGQRVSAPSLPALVQSAVQGL